MSGVSGAGVFEKVYYFDERIKLPGEDTGGSFNHQVKKREMAFFY